MYFAGTNGWIRNWFIFTLQTLKLIYSLSSNSFRCFEGVWNLAESVFCEIIWYFLDYFEIYFWYFVFHILQKFCINDVLNTILAPFFSLFSLLASFCRSWTVMMTPSPYWQSQGNPNLLWRFIIQQWCTLGQFHE